jgi:formylglycine-generating enzyme required for sulfatase activity
MKKLVSILLLASWPLLAAEPAKVQPPQGMAYVPAGTFIFGSNVGDADETPQQLAETIAFFIDLYEVGNADFKKFDPTYTFKAGYDDHAATVTWQQADAYARWLGKRLPTEKEWEKAARGTDGRLYPWGNTYDHTFVAWDETYPRGGAPAKPTSPCGCYDMAGGAWEWTSDWYQPYAGNEIPCENYGEKYKVMRGGASFNDYAMMRTTHRYYLPVNSTGNYYTGFRCVKDVEKK